MSLLSTLSTPSCLSHRAITLVVESSMFDQGVDDIAMMQGFRGVAAAVVAADAALAVFLSTLFL